MKYKDNRNLWDYIPIIVIALAVFTIIWWSIVLNASASGLQTVTVNNGYATYYQDIFGGYRYSKYTYHVPYTNRCCAYINSSSTDTVNGVTYTINNYVLVTDYTSNYTDNMNSTLYFSTNGSTWTETNSNSEEVFRLSQIGTTSYYQVGIGGNNALSGIPLFSSQEQALAYMQTGSEEGNLNHTPVNIYNPEIPSPDGYYMETTGLAHNGFNVYTNDVVLTNMGTYKAVVYMRYRTVNNLYMQRVSNTSPFTNVWWNTDIKTTWTSYKHINDTFNGTTLGNNNVRGIQAPDDNFEDWLELKAEIRVETELTPSGTAKSNKEFIVPWAQINAQLKRTDYVWNSIEYLVFYYTVLPNGDISFGPSTFFYKDYPPNLQGTIINGYEESAVLFDGTGYGVSKGYSNTESQSIVEGTASFGLKNLTEVDASGIVTVNDNGITINQGSNSLTTNGLGIESLQIGQMQQNFETIYTFVGAVPIAMAQWFGFMPSWIFSLIAFEISMLIVFGIVKKIVG